MTTIVDLARAYHFAATKHVDQRRKGQRAEPYINHLTEVAELVAQASGGQDLELIIAAVLHDVVEDTPTTIADVTTEFGSRVAGLVQEVTDDKSLPKAERKRVQIEHAAYASAGAKMIKLADKTANLRALASSPPEDWPTSRRLEYVAWARTVVAGCAGASPYLEQAFQAAAAANGQ
jgi:(p)ppGpp synthase/HD superfamily hydrolase